MLQEQNDSQNLQKKKNKEKVQLWKLIRLILNLTSKIENKIEGNNCLNLYEMHTCTHKHIKTQTYLHTQISKVSHKIEETFRNFLHA